MIKKEDDDFLISSKGNANHNTEISMQEKRKEEMQAAAEFSQFISNKFQANKSTGPAAKLVTEEDSEAKQEQLALLEKQKQTELKMKIQMVMNDISLSEEQKKIKIKILQKGGNIGKKIQNIMQKHHKRNERHIPLNKEDRFQQNMKIFKGLQTFIESKGIIQKMNALNEQEEKSLQSLEKRLEFEKALKQMNQLVNVTDKEEKDDYFFQSVFQQSISALQKAHHLLQDKIQLNLKSKEDVMVKSIVEDIQHTLTSNHYLKAFELKNDYDLQGLNFYDDLLRDIEENKYTQEKETKKFTAAQQSKIDDHDLELFKKLQERQQLSHQGDMEEKLKSFKQKSNKILQLIAKTSKNILKKNLNVEILPPPTDPLIRSNPSLSIIKEVGGGVKKPSFTLPPIKERTSSLESLPIIQKIQLKSRSEIPDEYTEIESSRGRRDRRVLKRYAYRSPGHRDESNQSYATEADSITTENYSFREIQKQLNIQSCGMNKFKLQDQLQQNLSQFSELKEKLEQRQIGIKDHFNLIKLKKEQSSFATPRRYDSSKIIQQHKKAKRDNNQLRVLDDNDDENSRRPSIENHQNYSSRQSVDFSQSLHNHATKHLSSFAAESNFQKQQMVKFDQLLGQTDNYKEEYNSQKTAFLKEIDEIELKKEKSLISLQQPKLESLRMFDKKAMTDKKAILFNHKTMKLIF